MSYQALYRVWRPQQFADVIGQTAITQTLQNALTTGQTSHAYLFCGPRGTGKTSVAKILAKALNCRHLDHGEPDNTCDLCEAINNGSLTDVIEIDAASNNGVDEIRDIRDKAKYAPTVAKVKVYIIDEVHMLSTGAFNALLKTLEEPPAHVVFILATTEPQKIPATIISRTQRFDFRRITAQDIVGRMTVILEDKGITYDEQALLVIAKAAEGGMRDALSILDQVLSFGQNHVTVENALDVTGGVAAAQLGTYLTQIGAHDPAAALTTIEQLLAGGKDAARLIEDLIEYLRDLLVFQQAPSLVNDTQSALRDDHFQTLAQTFTAQALYHMIGVLNETQSQLRLTNHPTLYLEVATVRLGEQPTASTAAPAPAAVPAEAEAVTALQAQVQALQETVAKLQTGAPVAAVKPKPKAAKHPHVNKQQLYPILGAATKADLTAVKDIWPDLLNMLSVTKRAMMRISEPVAASPAGVIVSFAYDILVERAMKDAALMTELESGLERLMGDKKTIVLVQQDEWPKVRKTYLSEMGAPKKTQPKAPTEAPVVKAITDMFGDEDNITIKND
ncbi:DNA polymerase III subunit gamma/tau [Lacticaseibacillus daqingensis]|uniref:DNA polymerase III subunit gamma/tau n=1 Tax=Lacticaseibacillus daqingensis TaxID=2486014 RepID=UPI0013DE0EBB|nr:DNA polymerase III subunit gamma/tau [Lacticaseibacillus daqingensis]